MTSFCIKVPASTANLGPGFDSIGLALNRYLNLTVTPSDHWDFRYLQSEYMELPQNEENLIYKTMAFTLDHLGIPLKETPCEVIVDSEIPLTRGLGSSATATVAGIELANTLYHLDLTNEQKARIGSLYEGHPDNVGASIYGGLTIGSHTEEETFIVPWGALPLDLLMVVPKTQLLTSVSRGQLPQTMGFRESVQASSYANVLIAALLKGDLQMAGAMMKRDLFHQPYRRKLVPQMEEIMAFTDSHKDCGVALSGAGPSVLVFMEKGRAASLLPEFNQRFPDCVIDALQPDQLGLTVSTRAL